VRPASGLPWVEDAPDFLEEEEKERKKKNLLLCLNILFSCSIMTNLFVGGLCLYFLVCAFSYISDIIWHAMVAHPSGSRQ
jgi:hypothetical protein